MYNNIHAWPGFFIEYWLHERKEGCNVELRHDTHIEDIPNTIPLTADPTFETQARLIVQPNTMSQATNTKLMDTEPGGENTS